MASPDYVLQVRPPWEPTVMGSLDTSQFDREFTSMPIFSPDQRENKARFFMGKGFIVAFFGGVAGSRLVVIVNI